jgi:hypothetical protein
METQLAPRQKHARRLVDLTIAVKHRFLEQSEA